MLFLFDSNSKKNRRWKNYGLTLPRSKASFPLNDCVCESVHAVLSYYYFYCALHTESFHLQCCSQMGFVQASLTFSQSQSQTLKERTLKIVSTSVSSASKFIKVNSITHPETVDMFKPALASVKIGNPIYYSLYTLTL